MAGTVADRLLLPCPISQDVQLKDCESAIPDIEVKTFTLWGSFDEKVHVVMGLVVLYCSCPASQKTRVSYSQLILCTVSDGPFPGKCNIMDSYHKAIKKYDDIVKEAAHSVLAIGGGATGVEIAAGIRTEYPNKKKVSNLDEVELNVTLKDRVIKTDTNEQFTVDLVISWTGNQINSDAYRFSLGGRLALNGTLKVNKHMQVEGFDNIYAVVDSANVNKPKMADHASLHAGVAARNINSLTRKALIPYNTGNVTMLLAKSRDDSVTQFNGYKLPCFFVTKRKSQSLLLLKSWVEMGQKSPS